MKLIRLEILHLASLDKPGGEVIDFTQGALGESNIFSIVGPTGSGKSTLLDAICLALYDRAPRYPKQKGEKKQKIEIYGNHDDPDSRGIAPTDCRNILTRGKREGYSKLTFLANNGVTYRAEWHVKFHRTQYADNVKLLYKLSTSADGMPIEEEADWTELPQIIGLDYEQFLRTVLIAQGSFANFLTAKEDERFALLEKLIGCEELYTSIAQAIKERFKAAETTYNQVSATVDAVKQNLLDDDALQALQTELKELEESEKSLTENLKQVEKELQWFVDDEKLSQAIVDRQADETKAKEALTAKASDFARLSLHDAIDPAVDLLREVKRLEDEIKKLNESIAAVKVNIDKQDGIVKETGQRLEELNDSLQNARQTLTDAAPHIAEARKLKTQISDAQTPLTEKENAHRQAKKDASAAQEALDANTKGIADAEKAQRIAEQGLAKLQSDLEKERADLQAQVNNIAELLQIEQKKIQGLDADMLQQDKARADKGLSDLQDVITVLGNLDKVIKEKQEKEEERSQLRHKNKQLNEELGTLDIESLNKEVDTLRRTYTLTTSEQWSQHRDLLHDGIPCPLCGATHHPYNEENQQMDVVKTELHDLLTAKDSELKSLRDRELNLSGSIKSNEGKIGELDKRLNQLGNNINELESNWEALHRQNRSLSHELAALQALLPRHEQAQQKANDALSQYNKVKKRIDELVKEKDEATQVVANFEKEAAESLTRSQNALNTSNNKLAELRGLTPTLSQQHDKMQKALDEATQHYQAARQELEKLQAAFKQELGGEEPDVVEKRLNKTISDLGTLIEQTTKQLGEHQAKLSKLQGILQTQSQLMEDHKREMEAKNGELNKWLDEYNTREDRLKEISMDNVSEMLAATDNWETIRLTKERLTQAIHSTAALLNQARKEHESHQTYKPELTREALVARQQELQQSSRQDKLIELSARLKSHHDAIVQLGDKAKELEDASLDKQDWKQISDSIGGEGNLLRKIAQCYTLQFLIDHANEEIRKFNSRYELQQVKNSLGIRVIDHDRADDVRDTTSLSGGETFIVSLGLALGMSSLSSCNISFGNLFIDEGFGTLDPDTLATVIDSLAMLQMSQGKKVGVISHTDTMSERITTQIRVVKNGSSGSSHIEIYP